ncbi:zinc finger protein [Theobroma cacao]|nr:zinc finger protein [Theobroma cacao]
MAGDSTSDSPSPSPNKRLKITTPNSKSIIQDEPSGHHLQQSRDDDDSDSDKCGICLSDGGRRAIRGKIDSCDHFFCFVCIMEWAKVESRCPMCKRRFTAIRRPPKEAVFTSERVVNIPQRDQVYHLCGNATSGPFDPYAEVKCSVCHGIADESLLLLCDLCDSAAHTYCVGLGATVPDGDWFCHDCALSRSEHEKTEVDTDTDNKMISGNSHVKLLAEANVSIFKIVRGSNIPVFSGHNASVSSLPTYLPPPLVPKRERNAVDKVSGPIERSGNTMGNSTEPGARTLGLCRNVHSRIRALRENWHSLQSRSLSFSSSMVESGGGSRRKGTLALASVSNYSSSEPQSSSSTSQQSTSQNGFVEPKVDLYDTDKAWKMMNIAKSMQKNCKRNSSLNQTSTKPPCPRSALKEAISSSGLHISQIQQIETRNEERTGKQMHYRYYYHETEKEKHKSPEMDKQKRMVMSIQSSERVVTSHSPRFSPSSSSTKFQIQNDDCHVNGVRPIVKNAQNKCQESSSNANKDGGYSCSTSSAGSVLRGSTDSLDSNLDFGVSILDILERRTRLEKSCSKSKDRRDDNVKCEIQSLVKLNLKLLNQDKRLGVDAFKEIARLATHTILAACGFQHSTSSIHSFPSSVCSHTDDIKLRHKSTLMSNSCRECFYVFVKNVVWSIMIEKGHSAPL